MKIDGRAEWLSGIVSVVSSNGWDTTSIIILIVLLLIWLLPGLIYLVYKLAKTKRCPYCGTLVNDMEPPRYDAHGPSMQPIASNSSVGKAYCPKCGAENRTSILLPRRRNTAREILDTDNPRKPVLT